MKCAPGRTGFDPSGFASCCLGSFYLTHHLYEAQFQSPMTQLTSTGGPQNPGIRSHEFPWVRGTKTKLVTKTKWPLWGWGWGFCSSLIFVNMTIHDAHGFYGNHGAFFVRMIDQTNRCRCLYVKKMPGIALLIWLPSWRANLTTRELLFISLTQAGKRHCCRYICICVFLIHC